MANFTVAFTGPVRRKGLRLMEADHIFRNYYAGNWQELIPGLEDQIGNYAVSGNVTLLSRAFSYYGIVNLIRSNDFVSSTLGEQIRAEYAAGDDDPRIKASHARFLALRHVFLGQPELVSRYYTEASAAYRQTDWYWDEAATLLESLYWHDLFFPAADPLYHALSRLETLNHYLRGAFQDELRLLHSIIPPLISGTENPNIGMENRDARNCCVMAKIFLAFIQARDRWRIADQRHDFDFATLPSGLTLPDLGDCPLTQLLAGLAELSAPITRKKHAGLERIMNILYAKAELFKHPWYNEQILHLVEDWRTTATTPQTVPLPAAALSNQDNPSGRIRVCIFEKFSLSCQTIELPADRLRAKTGQELLLFLITRKNLQAHRELLGELFFPDTAIENSFNRLYVNIHRLNKALEEHFGSQAGHGLIHIKQGIVHLNSDVLEGIDTHQYRKTLSVAHQLWPNDREASVELLTRATGMYSAEIAPGFAYLDWLDEYRSELQNLQVKALSRLFRYYREQHSIPACADAFYRLIELDPLDEEHYLEYLQFILKDGRKAEAFNLYRRYEKQLQKDLGVAPSSNLKGLMAGIGRMDP